MCSGFAERFAVEHRHLIGPDDVGFGINGPDCARLVFGESQCGRSRVFAIKG
jgi:hypothetical protein